MIEILMWWWGLGLIGVIFITYQDWKNGHDLPVWIIPVSALYVLSGGAVMLAVAIFNWDGWGKTILKGRKSNAKS